MIEELENVMEQLDEVENYLIIDAQFEEIIMNIEGLFQVKERVLVLVKNVLQELQRMYDLKGKEWGEREE